MFFPILPYIEQQSVYNSLNTYGCSLDFQNSTAESVGISSLWCPSDGTISAPTSIAGTSLFPGYTGSANVNIYILVQAMRG